MNANFWFSPMQGAGRAQMPLSMEEIFRNGLPWLNRFSPAENLREIWPLIAGAVIADHSWVICERDSILYVSTDNHTIKKEIIERADDILLSLEQCGCSIKIRDINVCMCKKRRSSEK